MGLVVDGRGRQHGDQAQGVGRGGHDRADAGVDGGQHGEDDAAHGGQGQADDVDDQVGGLFRRGPVVLGHVQLVGDADLHEDVLHLFEHGPIKPFSLFLFPPPWGQADDHSLNGGLMGDEGGGMRQKRHDSFRGA